MRTLSLLAALALLAGCASSTPQYDMRFGDAVRQSRQAMTLNPGAASSDPVAGMDGRAARDATGRYQESFKSPPPVVNVINIGGSSTGGGGGR